MLITKYSSITFNCVKVPKLFIPKLGGTLVLRKKPGHLGSVTRAGFRAVVVEATIPHQPEPSPTNALASQSLRKKSGSYTSSLHFKSLDGHSRTFRRFTFKYLQHSKIY